MLRACSGVAAGIALAVSASAQVGPEFPGERLQLGGTSSSGVAGDFDGDGHMEWRCYLSAPSPIAGSWSFELQPDGRWDDGVQLPAGALVSGIVADVNADGLDDLTANHTASGGIAVCLGSSQGLGSPVLAVASSACCIQLVAADLDADGALDLAWFVPGLHDELLVALGHGDATFSSPAAWPMPFAGDRARAADLHGDGLPELVLLDDHLNLVGIVGGAGAGPWALVESMVLPGLTTFLAVGDLQGDGREDFCVVAGVEPRLQVFGAAGLADEVGLVAMAALEDPLADLAFADLDGDGRDELAFAGSGYVPGTLLHEAQLVVLGEGPAGSLVERVRRPAGAQPSRIAVRDVEGDGFEDLVITESGQVFYGVPCCSPQYAANDLLLVHGRADTLVDLPVIMPTGSTPTAVAAGDLDLDGREDLAVLERWTFSVALHVLQDDGTLAPPVSTYAGWDGSDLELADADGDGLLDLWILNGEYNGGLRLALSTAPLEFGPPGLNTAGIEPQRLALADFDLDGLLDAFVRYGGVLGLLRGTGSTQLGPLESPGTSGLDFDVGDLDADGDPDLATLRSLGDGEYHFLPTFNDGAGHGIEVQALSLVIPGEPQAIEIVELDGNGQQDVVVLTGWWPDAVGRIFAQPDGTFGQPLWSGAYLDTCLDVQAHDLERDGDLDLVVARPGAQAVEVLANVGGAFAAPRVYQAGVGARDIVALDLDGDGNPELVVANEGDDTLTPMANGSTLWNELGGSLASAQAEPHLQATGSLQAHDPVVLALDGVGPPQAGVLLAGLTAAMQPWHGGVVVPSPDVLLPFTPSGEQVLACPPLPVGLTLWLQAWFKSPLDGAFSASNALLAVVP